MDRCQRSKIAYNPDLLQGDSGGSSEHLDMNECVYPEIND